MICSILEKLLSEYDVGNFKINKSNRPDLCDFQSNDVFRLSKELGKNPIELGEELVSKINSIENVEFYFKKVEFVKPGFINFTLSDKFICNQLIKMIEEYKFNIRLPEKVETFVLDYCGANVAKPLHVGHMRTTIVGESMARIIRFLNHKTVCDVHLGDYGLQIGQVIYGIKRDHKEIEEIDIQYLDKIYPEMSALCKSDDQVKDACADITRELHEGNSEYVAYWKKILEVSVCDIKKICDYLGANFDYWYGESDSCKYLSETKKILEDKNMLENSQGALIVNVSEATDKKEIPPLIFEKSNGDSLYASWDLATLVQRKKDFNPDHVLYVTDLRQGLHFEQVFRTTEKMGLFSKDALEHLGYGTVNGLDGKPFKTRDGNAPKLQNLFEEVKQIFVSKKEENKNLSQKDLDIIVNAILKYGDLQNSKEKDYIFNIDKFAETIGKTGPYILYTYLRVNKILRDNNYNYSGLSNNIYNESDRNLRMKLFDIEDYIYLAFNNRNSFYIADYIYDLALLVNNFYQNNNISNLKDEVQKNDWLSVLDLSARVLKELLSLLVIEIPSKM